MKMAFGRRRRLGLAQPDQVRSAEPVSGAPETAEPPKIEPQLEPQLPEPQLPEPQPPEPELPEPELDPAAGISPARLDWALSRLRRSAAPLEPDPDQDPSASPD